MYNFTFQAYVHQLCHNEVKTICSKRDFDLFGPQLLGHAPRTSSGYWHWLALGIRRVKKMLLDVYEKEDILN
ncbi:unnamed protein product [Caenorhabditis brenneri]